MTCKYIKVFNSEKKKENIFEDDIFTQVQTTWNTNDAQRRKIALMSHVNSVDAD